MSLVGREFSFAILPRDDIPLVALLKRLRMAIGPLSALSTRLVGSTRPLVARLRHPTDPLPGDHQDRPLALLGPSHARSLPLSDSSLSDVHRAALVRRSSARLHPVRVHGLRAASSFLSQLGDGQVARVVRSVFRSRFILVHCGRVCLL